MMVDRKLYAIIDLPIAKIEIKEKLNLSDMKVKLDHHADDANYNECWRRSGLLLCPHYAWCRLGGHKKEI